MNEAKTKLPTKRGFTEARGSAKLCMKPGCGEKATSRGLCPSCYRVARLLVREKRVTWDELVAAGKCTGARYFRESGTRDWLLAPNKLETDGGHIHELHATEMSPNTEIRQAGPETHEPNPQRNPALPASNG